ncbi:hypothetical protein QFC21_006364 [Naganishia friedmannii]|uniref:Uncharacterized protein n=1 Tax=Naganishia friedmannii TaxID=89922 RepID=A0ACC2V341_9TREE|nr:hypothetical protein QFC21_006364 [Naganishia friedmannii]
MSSPPPPATHRITRHSTPLRHLRLFNPTIVHLHPTTPGTNAETGTHDGVLEREKSITWSSRKARKGRYAPKEHQIHNPHQHQQRSTSSSSSSSPSSTTSNGNAELADSDTKSLLGTAVIRLKSVESEFKPHLDADISFWIAVAFTVGSVVWVFNGFLVLLPFYHSSLNPTTYFRSAAALAFLGGTIFEIGSYLMVVEAINRGRESNFGASLYHLAHPHRTTSSSTSTNDTVQHHRGSSNSSSSEKMVTPGDAEKCGGGGGDRWIDDTTLPEKQKFLWWGKPQWHDIGYLAAFVQLCAASIFWVATLTGLPGVIPGFPSSDPSVAITDVFFWTPQVIGGTGFIISALLLMLEVQTKWWKPALGDIGWHRFMICGAFGYSPVERWVEQSDLSTFWGSWSFLIGSVMQLYEVIWREPTPVDMKA